MSDTGKILGALVLGAAAGAALGLLFAPSKGSELREKISRNANDVMDELTEKINEGKEMLAGLKTKVSSKVEELRGKADELKSKAEESFSNMKTASKEGSATAGGNHSH